MHIIELKFYTFIPFFDDIQCITLNSILWNWPVLTLGAPVNKQFLVSFATVFLVSVSMGQILLCFINCIFIYLLVLKERGKFNHLSFCYRFIKPIYMKVYSRMHFNSFGEFYWNWKPLNCAIYMKNEYGYKLSFLYCGISVCITFGFEITMRIILTLKYVGGLRSKRLESFQFGLKNMIHTREEIALVLPDKQVKCQFYYI